MYRHISKYVKIHVFSCVMLFLFVCLLLCVLLCICFFCMLLHVCVFFYIFCFLFSIFCIFFVFLQLRTSDIYGISKQIMELSTLLMRFAAFNGLSISCRGAGKMSTERNSYSKQQ